MQQYPIPQFIEAESKITSFLTFRQFFYLLAAGGACFLLYFVLPLFLFFIAAFLICAVAIILAFGVINGTPLLNVVMGMIGFSMHGKDYTWQKKESPYPFKPIQRTQIKTIEQAPVLQAQSSQLKRTKALVELKTKKG